MSGEETESAKLSYFGRVGYEFAGRYMIQASLRADAADLSQLPVTNRWGYFPAVSAGWAISEEAFFEPARRYVSNLKLRASWGQNGSLAALSGYMYSTDMALDRIYPFFPGNNYIQGSAPSSMGNDELRWETSEQINIGLDARLFNDRLTFSLDWFDKKTKDLLVSGTTPSLIVGGTVSPINAGNVSNRGWEIELGWRDHVGDFSYSVRGNLATLKNKVTYLDPSLVRLGGETFHNTAITYFEKGYPIYYFRGYKFAGVDPATGDPTFEDLDKSGDLSDGDLTYIGDAIPDFTYGITLTAAWKGIDLTVFGTGSEGNDIFNCINKFDRQASNKLKEVFYDNRWTPANTSGTVPAPMPTTWTSISIPTPWSTTVRSSRSSRSSWATASRRRGCERRSSRTCVSMFRSTTISPSPNIRASTLRPQPTQRPVWVSTKAPTPVRRRSYSVSTSDSNKS